MIRQMELDFAGEVHWDAEWEEERRLLRRMADDIGDKRVGIELDVSPSQLSNALDERGRHLPARWISYLVRNSDHKLAREYVRRLAALQGLDLVDAPTPTPEEELAALKDALAESLGPELRHAVLAKAKVRRR